MNRQTTVILCTLCLLCGCRKELYNHKNDPDAQLLLEVDWSAAHAKPRSVDAYFFGQGAEAEALKPTTRAGIYRTFATPDGGALNLSNQPYAVVVYSSDYFDEDANHYRGMEQYATMEAYTNRRFRESFVQVVLDEYTVQEPDYLYAVSNEAVEVNMAAQPKLIVRPVSLVNVYYFTVKVKGLEYVQSTRGAISGMSESVFLATGQPSHVPATVLYGGTPTEGGARYEFRSFGPMVDAAVEHIISLEFLKKDGSIEQFDIVGTTSQVNELIRGGEIVLPTDEDEVVIGPADPDSGFEGDIDDWEETEVPLPIQRRGSKNEYSNMKKKEDKAILSASPPWKGGVPKGRGG